MPVITRYCDQCGGKIPSEDFDDNKALSFLYLAYCNKCRKTVEKVVNAAKEFESFETEKEAKASPKKKIILAAVAVVALVIGLVIGMQLGSGAGGDLPPNAKTKLASLNKEVTTLREKNEENTGRITALESEKGELEKQYNDFKSETDAELKRLNSRNDELKRDRNLLKSERAGLLNEKNDALKKYRELESDFRRLETDLSRLKPLPARVEDMEKEQEIIQSLLVVHDWIDAYNMADHRRLLRLFSQKSNYVKTYKKNTSDTLENFRVATSGVRYRPNITMSKIQRLKDGKVVVPFELVIKTDTTTLSQQVELTIGEEKGRRVILNEKSE